MMSMALMLSACSFSASAPEEPEQTPEPVIATVAGSVRRDVKNSGRELRALSCSGMWMYCVSDELTGENIPENVEREAKRKNRQVYNDGRYDVYSETLCRVNPYGRVVWLDGYEQLPGEENTAEWTDYASISAIDALCCGDDGSLTALEHTVSSGNSMPKDRKLFDPSKDYLEFVTRYYIRELDEDGTERSCRSISEKEAQAMLAPGGRFFSEKALHDGDTVSAEKGGEMFSLSSVGVVPGTVCSDVFLISDAFRFLTRTYDRAGRTYSYDICTVRLRRCTEGEEGFEKLTLACPAGSASMRLYEQVAIFNAENPKIRITVEETGSIADADADIYYISNSDSLLLSSQGKLADLYPYLDADEALDRSYFLRNILAAAEADGKLRSTCAGFAVHTLVGAASAVGNRCSWTYDDFREAWWNLGIGTDAFDRYTLKSEVYDECYAMDYPYFRENPDGLAQLEYFCSNFPETFDYAGRAWEANEPEDMRIRGGKQLLCPCSLYCFDDVIRCGCEFGSEIAFIGYPTLSGCGSTAEVSSLDVGMNFSLSADCENTDAAWRFLRIFFTAQYQESGAERSRFFPTNERIFSRLLRRAGQGEYAVDKNGELVYDKNGRKIFVSIGAVYLSDFTEVRLYPLSEQRAAAFSELARSVTKTGCEAAVYGG